MPSRAALRPLAAPSLLLLRASAPALPAVPCHQTIPKRAAAHHRPYSSLSSSSSQSGSSQSPPPRTPSSADEMPDPPPSRWYGELHRRIGKCILFGCDPSQVATAGTILGALATEWRSLLAGSEGFLTGARRGLEGQQVVWGEQDSFQHVNNVTYVRYAESSRVNWVLNFAHHVDPANREAWAELMTPKSVGLILKTIQVDFRLPMTYPDKVSVYHKLRDHPDSAPSPTSIRLDAIVLSHRHRRPAAIVAEDVVVYDYKAAKKTEVRPFMKEVLAKTYDLQVQEKLRARNRIWELMNAVTQLEKETWDRADAVEDMGSTGKSQ